MKKTKRSLFTSLITLLLCSAMFVGSTFAWFTDTVSNTGNKIQAGTLDVGLEQYKKTSPEADPAWIDIEGDEKPAFNSGEGIALWEPGYSQYGVFRITNKESNLAFKYKLKAELKSETIGSAGQSITDVIDVYTILLPNEDNAKDVYNNATSFDNFMNYYDATTNPKATTSLKAMMSDADGAAHGILIPTGLDYTDACLTDAEKATIKAEEAYAVVVLHMQESAGNEYQGLDATFDIKVEATQVTIEKDGFGACTYDAQADGNPDHPEFDLPAAPVVTNKLVVPVNVDDNNVIKVNGDKPEEERTVVNGNLTTVYSGDAIISDGTELANDKKTSDATTGFEYKGDTPRGSGITITSDQAIDSYELTLNVSNSNDKLIKNIVSNYPAGRINLKAFHEGIGGALVKLTTEELPTEPVDGTEYFYYNEETGKLVFWVFHPSPVEFVYDTILPVPTLETKEEIKAAMATAKSGDTLKIKAGQYYFGEGLVVPEGVNIVSDSSDDVFIVIPHMYKFDWSKEDYVGDDIGYIESSTSIEKSAMFAYGFEIYSNAFADLENITSVNVGMHCTCIEAEADGCSGKILASNHIILAGGLMVSHDKDTCNNMDITISFGNPAYSFNYTYKCVFD